MLEDDGGGDDEQVSDGHALDTWVITIPKEGPKGRSRRRKGVDKWRFTCLPESSDQIRHSLQRLNASIRRGAPMVFCNDVELYPEAIPAHELRDANDLPAVLAPAAAPIPGPPPPPDDEQLAVLELKVGEARLTLASIRMQADAEQRRLESIQNDIKYRQEEREREVQRSIELAGKVQQGLLKGLQDLTAHVNDRRNDAMAIESQVQGAIKDSIKNFTENGTALLSLKSTMIAGLGVDRFAELIRTGKEITESVFNSDIAKMATLAVNSKVAESISKKLGREVDPDAVLRAHVLTGEHFLKRRAMLLTLCAAHPASVPATMISLTINFEDGHISMEQLMTVFS